MKKDEHPVSVYSAGGLYGFKQDESTAANRTPGTRVYGNVETYGHDKTSQETPNTQTASYQYADGTELHCELRKRKRRRACCRSAARRFSWPSSRPA